MYDFFDPDTRQKMVRQRHDGCQHTMDMDHPPTIVPSLKETLESCTKPLLRKLKPLMKLFRSDLHVRTV